MAVPYAKKGNIFCNLLYNETQGLLSEVAPFCESGHSAALRDLYNGEV